MGRLKVLAQVIETINDRVGSLFSFLLIPLMVITAFEVVSRYIFNSPTIWAWDINIQIFGVLIIIGGSYGFRHNMHVKVDVFVEHLSPRVRAGVDLVTSVFVFFTLVVMIWKTIPIALESLKMRETMSTIWGPPIFHIMVLIPIGAFLFLLQGIAILIRSLATLIQGSRGGA